MFNSDLYSDIKNAFLDWMDDTDNEGNNVADVALLTINRAQHNLERYDTWDGLVKDYALSLTDKTAILPSDIGELIAVYHDSNSDGKPDWYYYRDGDYSSGYKIRQTFNKATGHSATIQFFNNPSNTPIVRYKAKLADFTGEGSEYSYFPFDLLLLEAQYIHITESGLVGNDYQAVMNRRKEILRDYRQEHQYKNNDMRVVQRDYRGWQINNDAYSLTGEEQPLRDGLSNDFDRETSY